MGYLIRPSATPPRRVATIPARNPFDGDRSGFVAGRRSRSHQPTRVRVGGAAQLGILPLVAAAVPSVTDLLKNAATSVIGIVDPGKKRDANRQARARMYGALGAQGSITAANRVYSAAIGIHGGAGPTKEAGWYKEEWQKIQAAVPELAAKVPSLPRVGLPDPQEPTLSAADQTLIQNEIAVYHNVAATAGAGAASQAVAAGVGGNTSALILGLGVLGAFLVSRKR